MQKDYYQNILYPLQDRILELTSSLPVHFYITGGTVLSRVYLHHRFSDDIDFFLNNSETFKLQVEEVRAAIKKLNLKIEVSQAEDDFARFIVYDTSCILKLDFINDVPSRSELPVPTSLFIRTDTPRNIFSNKVTALSRLAVKDVADIVYLSLKFSFDWKDIIFEASEKDMWVNAIEIAKILDEFPLEKLNEIKWVDDPPDKLWFGSLLKKLIKDILQGNLNSLSISANQTL